MNNSETACYNLVMLGKFCIAALITVFLFGEVSVAERSIKLPTPKGYGKMSLEESILRRRSERNFTNYKLTLDQLSQIFWAAQGITDPTFSFRAAPSAGALYPLKLYLLQQDGVYAYVPKDHKLIQISEEDKRPSLVRASLGQSFIQDAPASIVIAADFSITQRKYGPRAFRYVCMEIGHVAENIHLQAVALGLGSIPVGAFWNDVVKNTLELPEEEDPIYIIPIGFIGR